MKSLYKSFGTKINNILIDLLLIRRKLALEYDQIRLTTNIAPNNCNKI